MIDIDRDNVSPGGIADGHVADLRAHAEGDGRLTQADLLSNQSPEHLGEGRIGGDPLAQRLGAPSHHQPGHRTVHHGLAAGGQHLVFPTYSSSIPVVKEESRL